MKKLLIAIKPFLKRYDLLIIFGLITLIYCIIEYYFFFPFVLGMSVLRSGNVLDNMMYVIQFAFKYLFQIEYLIYGLIGIVVSGFLMGFISSGLFHSLNNFLSKKSKAEKGILNAEFLKSQYLKGVKQHFWRMSFISAATILYTILFVAFMVVVSIPAIALLRGQIEGEFDFLGLAVLFTIITAIVLFFGFMFFRIYMLFWYPAAFSFKGKIFAIGKKAADTFFWKVVAFLMVFDVVFCSFQLLLMYLNSLMAGGQGMGILRFLVLILLNWIIKTVLFILLTVFIFSRFLLFKKRVVKKES
ncbi:hypothetical protein RBH29_00725 [Herbivorax sp. ANBcel31]|uniref:hypothetical protein n=1 Tax=Herbivorax sp. ANBcel31 TaxID=3069754 RepID=UPI0027B40960|nr:hypothetical protein [Herbivorax sp. ANBcel31]MDQ2084960.1 hypothetical protein [Herbivorax sp. ANBcel31]